MDRVKEMNELLNIVLQNYDASQRGFNSCEELTQISRHFASGKTLRAKWDDTLSSVQPFHFTESQEIRAFGQLQTLLIMQNKMEEAVTRAMNLIYMNGHVINTIQSKLEINRLLHQHHISQCQQLMFPNFSPESVSEPLPIDLSLGEQSLQHSYLSPNQV